MAAKPAKYGAANSQIRCPGCSKIVYPQDPVVLTKASEKWHTSCFKCNICNMRLNTYNNHCRSNKVYCPKHAQELSQQETAPSPSTQIQSHAQRLTYFSRVPPEILEKIMRYHSPIGKIDYTNQQGREKPYVLYGKLLQELARNTAFSTPRQRWNGLSAVEWIAREVIHHPMFEDLHTRGGNGVSWVGMMTAGVVDEFDYEKQMFYHSAVLDFEECYCDYKERQAQIAIIKERWGGYIPYLERRTYNPCFDGNGMVMMSDGTTKPVKEIKCGDVVKTESGERTVVKVFMSPVFAERPLVNINGVLFTRKHPVFMNGKWARSRDIATPEPYFVENIFNFLLEGGALATDHTVFINNILVATIGKNVGLDPITDALYGSGYFIA